MSLQEILDEFLANAYIIADSLGYEINAVADDSENNIDIVVLSDGTMPDITIYPVQVSSTLWQFSAEIEFPSVELRALDSTAYNSYQSMLDSWKDAADLVDCIISKTLNVEEYVDMI